MKKMTALIDGVAHYLRQPHADPSVWSTVAGSPTPPGVLNPGCGAEAVGWVVVYVDDFLIIGPDDVRNGATEAIRNKWK